jgi:hypothetical protein
MISSCNANFGNCNGVDGDGCEANLLSTLANCGACGTNCSTLPHPNTSGFTCSVGSCAITSCAAGFHDRDGVYTTGCECMADTFGNDCGAANDIGTVGIGALQTRTGNLVATGADSDWFRVTFPAVASCAYRPRITISTGGQPIAFRVHTSCSGSAAGGGFDCAAAEGGTSGTRDITVWEYNNQTTCGDFLSIDATPDYTPPYISIPTTVYIQVIATGSSLTCLPYTLTVAS